MSRQPADDLLRDGVAGELAVAEEVVVLGRDHVRRVADGEPEPLACRRLEVAPGAQLDVLGTAECSVERGEVERALVQVGRDHPARVARREDRLDPAAGGDVERRLDRPPHGQLRERDRGIVDSGDVARRLLLTGRIGGDQDVLVGDEPNRRPDEPAARLDEAERDELLDPNRREGPRDLRLLDRRPEDEQRRDRPERLTSLEPSQEERHVGGPHQHLAANVQRLANGRAVVAGGDEHLAKLADEPGVGDRERARERHQRTRTGRDADFETPVAASFTTTNSRPRPAGRRREYPGPGAVGEPELPRGLSET